MIQAFTLAGTSAAVAQPQVNCTSMAESWSRTLGQLVP
jgi:hypothetical protein